MDPLKSMIITGHIFRRQRKITQFEICRIGTHATALKSHPYNRPYYMAHIPCGNQSKPKLRFPLY